MRIKCSVLKGGGLGVFFVWRLLILVVLDFFQRLNLGRIEYGTIGVFGQVALGVLNQLPMIVLFNIFTGVVLYISWNRRRVSLAIITILDLLYLLMNFTSYMYFIFFGQFPTVVEISRLGSLEVWVTVFSYILPRIETLLILMLPLVLLVAATFLAGNRVNVQWSGRKVAIIGSILSVMIVLYWGMVSPSVGKSEYRALHPLTSRTFRAEFFHRGSVFPPPPEIISILRDQVDCRGNFLSQEYPLYKESVRTPPSPDLFLHGMPNIVIVMIESFASQNIGALGGEFKVTPHFDRMAREGILFTNMRSLNVSTTIVEVNTLCSQWIMGGVPGQFLKHEIYSLPRALKENGYGRAVWFHNGEKGFEGQDKILRHIGFDGVNGIAEMPADCERGPWGCSDKSLMKFAVDEMRSMEEPFLSFILTVNNHPPFTPYPQDGERIELEIKSISPPRIKSLEMVNYSDQALGYLVELCSREDFFQRTVFVITADHSLREKDLMPAIKEYSDILDQSRVPLLIWGDLIEEAQTISKNTYSVDITPTLLGLLGISTRDSFSGMNLFGKEPACERFNIGRSFMVWGDYALVMAPGLPVYRLEDRSELDGKQKEAVFRKMMRNIKARRDYYPILLNEGKLYPK